MFKKTIGKIAAFAVVLSCLTSGVFAMSKSPAQEEVEVPQRIISLAASGTEVLFAIGAGDRVVAVDDFSNYPAEAVALPKIGGFDGKTISVEKILSFEPEFIYLSKGMHDFLIPTLDKYGIKYYMSEGSSVDGIKKEILDIGAICGNDKEASEVVSKIDEAIAGVVPVENAPKVYYEVSAAPYYSVGGNTFINDIISKAGGKNIFAEMKDWPMVSEEDIIAANPDVIIVTKFSGMNLETIKQRQGWDELNAVKNNKVIVVEDDIYSRPSPRVSDAIIDLASQLAK